MRKLTTPQQSFLYFAPGVHVAYLAVPKVATRSVLAAMLSASYQARAIAPHSGSGQSLLNRRSAVSHHPDIPVFTIVREPVDRFISFYANKFVAQRAWDVKGKRTRGFAPALRRLGWLGFDAEMSLDEAALHLMTVPHEDMDPHGQPQWRILTEDSSLIPDYVVQLESIERDWGVVATLSGCGLQLSGNTSSAPRAALPTPSSDTISLLERYYCGDYHLLGYGAGERHWRAEPVDARSLGLAELGAEVRRRNERARQMANKIEAGQTTHFDHVAEAWESFGTTGRWGSISTSHAERVCHELGRVMRRFQPRRSVGQ